MPPQRSLLPRKQSQAYCRSSCPSGECFARHPRPVNVFSVRRSWFPEGSLHNGQQLLYAKGFFDARRPALCQKGLRLAVGGVSADQDNARAHLLTILWNPRMHFAPVYFSGLTKFTYHSTIFPSP